MLQLQAKTIDICRISKLLAKYHIKASITEQDITLEGNISDELLEEVCNSINICTIQNFVNKKTFEIHQEIKPTKEETKMPEEIENHPVEKADFQLSSTFLQPNAEKLDLLYPTVKRGEVYWCDFGKPYGSEQGYMRPAIIIQNDVGNLHSPLTIVIPCTTEKKKQLPTHFYTYFSNDNINIYDDAFGISSKEQVILAEQIQTVDKRRLRKYIGILKPNFMQKLQSKIDISLGLNIEKKTIEKHEKVFVDRPVEMTSSKEENTTKESKDINMVQIQLLSLVNINEILQISQSKSSKEEKIRRMLELYGFDFQKKGMEYLLEAILFSLTDHYFNLETLSENISNQKGIEKEEVKRLIVARVKEQFKFKKAPTIDFIRLLNNFLTK